MYSQEIAHTCWVKDPKLICFALIVNCSTTDCNSSKNVIVLFYVPTRT